MQIVRKNVLIYRFRNMPFNENALFYIYYGFYNKGICRRFYFTNLLFLRLFKYYRFKPRHLIRFKILEIIFRALRRIISPFVRLSLTNRRLNKTNQRNNKIIFLQLRKFRLKRLNLIIFIN